ncbi:MAG TPA: hypothetical protein VK619_03660 [Pyrinomonadaceae bacterium]|nr:hypothetical protein [Pyrinomonadaceae bacterium]
MSQQKDEKDSGASQHGGAPSHSDDENELEAEQESAEAMDAEVPQPSGSDKTTEGQSS